MSQKLAIAISGAVSLGSYEAGVMYEILEAICQHNQNLKSEEADLKIEVDVITGASAGAMTACILAQKLMFEGDRLKDPFDNDLYNPWVTEVDIDGLIKFDENPNFSILSSEEIQRIGKKYLLSRYLDPASGQPLEINKHPAVAPELYLGLAMANLNGVDYSREIVSAIDKEPFTYTRFKDRYLAKIQTQNTDKEYEEYSPGDIKIVTDDSVSWEFIEKLARSSGAFPFAFRPVAVERKGREYPTNSTFKGEAEKIFTYTDGGVFENEPLGMAQELASRIDGEPSEDSRFYLFVAPKPKESSSNQINEETAHLLSTGITLIGAIFNQSRFRDWIVVTDPQNIKSEPQPQNIYSVTAEDKDLIGEDISAFVGFFEEDYRKYDYFTGRKKAVAFLRQLQQTSKAESLKLSKIDLTDRSPTLGETTRSRQKLDELAGCPNEALNEVDRQTRKRIKKLLLDRLNRILDLVYEDREQETPWWIRLWRRISPIRWIVKKALNIFLSGKIDELLKL